ncbi:MAG: DUF3060 domain-containing protein [Candidatus Eremiobacteraeota bacterium]|nr:DUF3060 domain-containing protein [Candidatus Eremiobacteraeota bacterium]
MRDLQVKPGGSLEARCNECSLRVQGDFQELRLDGKDNFVILEGRARVIRLAGQHNSVECADGPEQVFLSGSGQRVKITEQPGRSRPQIRVEGTDQAVTYRPPNGKADSTAAESDSASHPPPPENTHSGH